MGTKKSVEKSNSIPFNEGEKRMVIKFPVIILIVVSFIVYAASLGFGLTELDDTIFINETAAYNEQLSNLGHSFKRGVFSEANDTYYRPMLLNSFIINHAVSGTEVRGYHMMNVLLHIGCVVLLFYFLRRIRFSELHSFFLALVFAVHPVLSQAVAWIPGRNDTLLTLFVLLWMLACLQYEAKNKLMWLILQFFTLLAALFTKETMLFVLPAFFIVWNGLDKKHLVETKRWLVYSSWILAIVCWFVLRQSATLKDTPIAGGIMFESLLHRFPLAIQYLGKILLPVNLNVFPMMDATTYLWGAIAVVLIGVLVFLSKPKEHSFLWKGIVWFILILFPLFLLPATLNDQDFEHRLYLPIIGILLLLGDSFIFQKLNERKLLIGVIGISAILAVVNVYHQQQFESPLTFWEAAVKGTPSSSYANMMLAARIKESDPARADAMMRKAYQMNPKEKYVNYYLGKDFLDKNQVDSAIHYFEQETKASDYYETNFWLARAYFLRQDTVRSIRAMGLYVERDKLNSQAINNYVLMLCQTRQQDKAKAFIQQKQQEGVVVPAELVNLANQK